MNKNTTTRLTDAEIHQLKYPKAQIVDVDIFEDETLPEQDIMAMVDQQHLTPPHQMEQRMPRGDLAQLRPNAPAHPYCCCTKTQNGCSTPSIYIYPQLDWALTCFVLLAFQAGETNT